MVDDELFNAVEANRGHETKSSFIYRALSDVLMDPLLSKIRANMDKYREPLQLLVETET